MYDYPCIDTIKTGEKIKFFIYSNGCTVKEVQKVLGLSCPQSIYRWMKGQVLPSVDHLYALSKFFHVHMEELIIEKRWIPIQMRYIFEFHDVPKQSENRIVTYYQNLHMIF